MAEGDVHERPGVVAAVVADEQPAQLGPVVDEAFDRRGLAHLLPPAAQRGKKPRPVGSNVPEGYPSPINRLVIGRASRIGNAVR
jgi:hypothetical protein